jgi:hypothetical protein
MEHLDNICQLSCESLQNGITVLLVLIGFAGVTLVAGLCVCNMMETIFEGLVKLFKK